MSGTTLPVVSVCLTTYQHKEYIRQCIDSILAQETDFSFELVIGEDESTDGTREICEEYAKKYPEKIRLFLRSRKDVIHIEGKPTGRFNFLENLKASKGKYIALCEGDDYWTDPKKLQQQIDLLESRPDVAICFHNVQVQYDDGRPSHLWNDQQPQLSTYKDLLKGNYISTASCVFRKTIDKMPDWFNECQAGDFVLHILNAQSGKIFFINKPMAAYRIHSNGTWGTMDRKDQLVKILKIFDFLIKNFEGREEFIAGKFKFLLWLASLYEEEKLLNERDELFKKFFNDHPNAAGILNKQQLEIEGELKINRYKNSQSAAQNQINANEGKFKKVLRKIFSGK